MVFTGRLTGRVLNKHKVLYAAGAVCEAALTSLTVLVALIAVRAVLDMGVGRAEVQTLLRFKGKNLCCLTARAGVD